ncbi:MAG: SRPBCC family protein [Bacteroidota bacterium]|nr:SRPBCC family protein [Bacteroidota bacterium]
MKALKYFIILLVIGIIASVVYFSLQDGTYSITEEYTIEAPTQVIYEQIDDFESWNNWNPWTMQDGINSTMGEQTSGVGGYYTFTDEYGNGKMTITNVDPNKKIVFDMQYDSGFAVSNSEVSMMIMPEDKANKVIWNIKGENSLKEKMLNAIFGIDLEKEIRPMYQQGLKNLDSVVQQELNKYTVSVDGVLDTGGSYYLYMSTSATTKTMETLQESMFQNIKKYMNIHDIKPFGNPMIIFEKNDPTLGQLIFSAAIPVKDRIETETGSNVLCGFTPATQAIKTTLKGKHEFLNKAWEEATAYRVSNNLDASDISPYIVYRVSKDETVNPAAYLTEIYLPIQE